MPEKTVSKSPNRKKSSRRWFAPRRLFSDNVKWRWLNLFDLVFLRVMQYINHIFVAVTIIIIAITFATLMFRQTPRTADELRNEYHAGLVANDYKRAAKALDELILHSPSEPNLTFDKALLEYELGDKQLARKLFEELMQAGHSRAAVWLMNDEFSQRKLTELTPEQNRRFNELLVLSKSATLPTDKAIVHELAARFCMANGQTDRAIEHLVELVKEHPEAHHTLASAYEQLGRNEEALEQTRRSRDYLIKELSKKPESKQLREQLIERHLKLNEEKDAVNVSVKGFQLTRDPAYQQATARIMLSWARRLKSEGSSQSLEDRIVLIHNATQYAPQDADVINELQAILVECHNTTDFESRSSQVLARGMAMESMHFMLGLHLLMHGNITQGIQHLEQAELRKAAVTPVLNAFLLKYASEGAPQRARAIDILKQLHEYAPEDSYIEQAMQKLNPSPTP